MKLRALLFVLLATRCAVASELTTPINAGSSAVFDVTFCNAATGARTAPCASGVPVAATTLSYGINDVASHHVLLSTTTLSPPTMTTCANAAGTSWSCLKLVIPATSNKVVGTCRNAPSTFCTQDADCGAGTCKVASPTGTQRHELTLEWTYTNTNGTCVGGSKVGYPCTVNGDCPSSTCNLTGAGTDHVSFEVQPLPFSPLP